MWITLLYEVKSYFVIKFDTTVNKEINVKWLQSLVSNEQEWVNCKYLFYTGCFLLKQTILETKRGFENKSVQLSAVDL